MIPKLYAIALVVIANAWLWGAIGWTLVVMDYPYGNVLPVYAE